MATNSITSKFSPGDRVYFPIFTTADIIPAIVKDVFTDNGAILYDIMEAYSLELKYDVPEAEIMTFAEAKASLLAYLSQQTIKVQAIAGI